MSQEKPNSSASPLPRCAMSDIPKHGEPGHVRHDTACAGCAAEAMGIRPPAGASVFTKPFTEGPIVPDDKPLYSYADNRSASPGPWRWGIVDDEGDVFADDSLRDANGKSMRIYNEGRYNEADRTLIASAPDMLALLRELEWAGHDCVALCPVCGQRTERTRSVPGPEVPGKPGLVFATRETEVVPGGHATDCRLNALLRSLP